MTREQLILLKFALQHFNPVTTASNTSEDATLTCSIATPTCSIATPTCSIATPSLSLTTPTLDNSNVAFLMDLFHRTSDFLLDAEVCACTLKAAHASPVGKRKEESCDQRAKSPDDICSISDPLDFIVVR
jgi:hypothetical protein